MKFKYSILIFIFSGLLILEGCAPQPEKKSLNNLDWLIGTWQGESRTGNIYFEEWNKAGANEFVNHNYHFEQGIKVNGGTSRIVLENNDIYYVNDTDSLKKLRWKAIAISPASATFANDSIKPYNHITFTLSPGNTWDATLTGAKDTITYSLKRMS